MSYAIAETQLPVRLRFERPMTDAELLRFCEANEVLRVERDANGEIIVMTPAAFGSSNMRVDLWVCGGCRGSVQSRFIFDALPDFLHTHKSVLAPKLRQVENHARREQTPRGGRRG